MTQPALLPELHERRFDVATRATTAAVHPSAEYDLHGIVGIRLLGASPADLAAVAAQLGPIQAPLARSPDIVIRFVDRLSVSEPMSLIGVDAAFDDNAFVILKGKHKSPIRVSIPFDAIGDQCEIECEHGAPAIPLLIAIINLAALGNGALPVHASAFRHAGKGVLVAGWSKGGKTETLLAFLANGAEYIGDEWIYLADGGHRMYGIPEPIRVSDWHLDDLPADTRRLSLRKRLRLATLRYLTNGLMALAGSGRADPAWKQLVRRLANLVEGQRHVHIAPRESFGARFGGLEASLDKVIFVGCHSSSAITTRRVSGKEVAARMAFSLQEERSRFTSYYRRFRFAFPDRDNPLIDGAEQLEREGLRKALEDKECHEVLHPYPVSIPALFDAVRPLIETERT
jgi:hypothetical protein